MIRNSAPTRAQKWNAFFIAFAIVISYFAVMGAYSWGPSFLPATATVTMEEEGSHRTESLFSKVMWFYTRERPTPREAILKEPIEWRIAPEDSAQPAVSQSSFDAPAYPNRMSLLTKVFRIIRQHAPKNKNAHALAEAIVREAERQGYDPLFVAAVIKSESTFNSFAKSNKGAQGLMQLMPKTSRWLAQKHDLPKGKLTDPGYNLQLGVRYLKHLETDLYGGDKVFTLIAYNWGPGHVESAADGKRRVPPEVMTYSVKILNDYRRWKADLMSGAL